MHFWSLVFLYIWAGPHHLLYTALPDWAQTLGMVFSLMLWAPSWGGMINGLLTLRGAWDKLRTDPVLKFYAAAVTFYGMSTFEGPLMSIKSVNALSHYTNWTISHAHGGALGWNGFLVFGMLYWLVPKLWNTKLHSVKWATAHFWLGLVGIGVYMVSMYAAGIAEGLMWKAFDEGGRLVYGTWTDMVPTLAPMYWARGIGGLLYFAGLLLMVVNLIKTAKAGQVSETQATAPAMAPASEGGTFHRLIEGKPLTFTVLTTVAVLIGGIAEIVPSMMIESNVPTIASVKPLTPLELEGRDIYIAEGCYTCHSQMIRPFRAETLRYGEYSKPGEHVYDHPFQFGSRRIGPDLARVGIKYGGAGGAAWHYNHMLDPRSTSPGSIMPRYPWLFEQSLELDLTSSKIGAFQTLGVPYTDADVKGAVEAAKAQATGIAEGLLQQKLPDIREKKIVALIAYLQRLGTDISKAPKPQASAAASKGGEDG